MFWLALVLSFIGIYLFFLVLTPKGNLLHEILHIPLYNWRMQTTAIKNISVEKIPFGKHRRQYLLFIEPDNRPVDKDKIIVYYHGGGWMFGNPKQFIINATYFTEKGYTVIMPCYRCLPFYRFKTIREDLNLGIQKSLEIMASKKIAHKKIILGGMSAGANLAGLILLDKGELEKMSLSQNKFAGLMLFGGPLNLYKMARTPLLFAYAGPRKSTSFNKASPFYHLNENLDLPILIVHGTKDGLVHYHNSTTFHEKLQDLSFQKVTFHTIESGTHLDAGKWVFNDPPVNKWLNKWLFFDKN